MELVAGYPYWLIKNGLLYQYPKLLENEKIRVAIIGGGISGALTAYYLTKAGIECMVVDSRTIGLGSTCASTSLLQYELDIPLHKLKKIVGDYRAVRSYGYTHGLPGYCADTARLLHVIVAGDDLRPKHRHPADQRKR